MMLPTRFKHIFHAIFFTFFCFVSSVQAAVILQYHHVSDTLPKVTSISAEDFEAHLQYLVTNEFKIISLPALINALQSKQLLPPKTIAITFDDGYTNNYTSAAPLLEKYQLPYTIFVNPKLIDQGASYVMTWAQLKELSTKGATIANHSASHAYLHQRLNNEDKKQWLARIREDIVTSEQRITQEIGHNYRYLAYPYGEFNSDLQELVQELGFVGIGQHSGAIGLSNDLTRLPRFPASGIYSNLETLKTKLTTLAFDFTIEPSVNSVTTLNPPSIILNFKNIDFRKAVFQCFISADNQAILTWHNTNQVTITAVNKLKLGRTRFNCTAPSIKHSGQYYWFSQPWVIEE
ncbi:polysaccharide deacetylase family protein [Pseudoalteromonas tunicata]|uniref:polysaccharide deacetylase family protein n=1 Tax=Pseudoalteromonas tunicata TaxID=314281 RepID=UPI0003086F31|nr:polysaccharide deacetylase family protein [Pseudoalteromonas tunicata]ATC96095.1 hypothetical protein PTUN_a3828 [Pseudoalteromonas tunicata]